MEELGLSLIVLVVITFFSPQLTLWLLLLLSTVVAYSFFRSRFSGTSRYWASRGVKQPGWNFFPLGNNAANSTWVKMGRTDPVDAVKKQYKDTVGEEENRIKMYGTYDFGLSSKPVAYLADLELAKKVLEGEESVRFKDREARWPVDAACDTRTDRIWSRQLVNLNGQEWKKVQL